MLAKTEVLRFKNQLESIRFEVQDKFTKSLDELFTDPDKPKMRITWGKHLAIKQEFSRERYEFIEVEKKNWYTASRYFFYKFKLFGKRAEIKVLPEIALMDLLNMMQQFSSERTSLFYIEFKK